MPNINGSNDADTKRGLFADLSAKQVIENVSSTSENASSNNDLEDLEEALRVGFESSIIAREAQNNSAISSSNSSAARSGGSAAGPLQVAAQKPQTPDSTDREPQPLSITSLLLDGATVAAIPTLEDSSGGPTRKATHSQKDRDE